MSAVILGKRRFTCLSPRLVRLEFSPSGIFEDRHSLVACAPRQALPFDAVSESGEQAMLKVGALSITSRQNEQDFFPSNLQIDWQSAGLTHTWYYGDRDYRNLGGTVRALDGYNRDGLLEGVHPASGGSPDEYFHTWFEQFAAKRAYQADGKSAWSEAIDRQGLHATFQNTPQMVYNRYQNILGDQARYQPGLLSRNGYYLLNDSTGAILDEDNFPIERNTPGTRDLYFFAYGLDYPAALRDFIRLSGPIPLPARNIFGIIFSRWPAFDEAEGRALIARFEQAGVPLSTLVLDLEWHVPDWWQWDWNTRAFPDPVEFLRWAHSQNVQVTLNVHPDLLLSTDSHFEAYLAASGTQAKVGPIPPEFQVDWMIKNGAERQVPLDLSVKAEAQAFQQVCCEPIMRQGVDFWWLDGSTGALNGADTQITSSKVYYETSQVDGRRGMLLGRYGGLGSHRYGVFFTGDTHSQWEVLRSQCEFNIRAGQVGMAYVSHDIGGFFHAEAPLIDPDLYLRWLEFGVFNPVMRFHSSTGAGSRLPWDYGTRNAAIALHWLAMRNSLVPYLYAAARQAYETGLPIVRGLYLENPLDEAGYRFDEYYFGEALLIAPILGPANYRSVYLPAGDWYDFASSELISGGRELPVYAALDQIPAYVKAGSILVRQDGPPAPAAAPEGAFPPAFVHNLLLDVYPGPTGRAILYEDDSYTQNYQSAGFAKTTFSLQDDGASLTLGAGALVGQPYGAGRQVRVQVALPGVPTGGVSFNGAALAPELCSYDPATRRLLVDLGDCPLDRPWQLVITRQVAS